MMKCLIVDFMHESIQALLSNAGIAFDYLPEISREEIIRKIRDYDGLIIRSKTKVDVELLANANNLKFVGRAGAGIDNLDEDILNELNIKIINAPEGNRNALGEHCVALLLGLLNNVVKGDREVRQGIWDREGNRGYELGGKTVVLLGYGNMGSCFARKLKSFECEVLAFDKYKTPFQDEYARSATMEEIFEKADIFSLHVPLTAETRGLIDIHYLNRFKKDIFLINSSRGEVLPLAALKAALESGKIRGAALDVLENEKLDQLNLEQQKYFHYLVNSHKIILTPHVGGWSYESYEKINNVLVDKIVKEFKLD